MVAVTVERAKHAPNSTSVKGASQAMWPSRRPSRRASAREHQTPPCPAAPHSATLAARAAGGTVGGGHNNDMAPTPMIL